MINENTTLWKRWNELANKYPDKTAIIHWVAGEKPYIWTYSKLLEAANKFSHLVFEKGIKKGEVCAIIMRHNPFFYPLYLGISGIGALPAVLAYPNPRLHPDKFRQGLAGMSQRSGLNHIFTEKDLEPIISPFIESEHSTVKDLFFPLEWNLDSIDLAKNEDKLNSLRDEIKPTDALLLQHSSGTTGIQKPVVLSHQAILQHVNNLAKVLQLDETDKVATWLPLYHDMGLIGCLHTPLAFGIPIIQLDPFEWVIAPVILLEAIHQQKATFCWLPNFAYNIMADKIKDEDLEDISLESVKMFINCSEPVRAESHDKFSKRFLNYGFNPNALGASYAMAETTFAVTQTERNLRAKEIKVDRVKLSQGLVDFNNDSLNFRTCVSSGKIINGCSVKIVDENRVEVSGNLVGEIAVNSVSMFDGYRNYPEKTEAVLDSNGWYYTGDYGFIFENELFVIGRKKDIIIVAGKNIYPEDVEDIVSQVKNVFPGRVVAFGEDDPDLGTEQISVIAETNFTNVAELKKLKMDIIKTAMEVDINIHHVYLVPPRWLIKSSAGKPSRKANKERIMNDNDKQIWSEK
ncbi:MAG: hypothetical protein CO129_10955 [Ignavibacteriales bacterium CG_4_9_14_3_um_filter_34_10]|nr:MAG: hypothetical protein CO129_10955 [Ignavibacteriales bacterium CG_4_9_14_3_um_filter_34_10]